MKLETIQLVKYLLKRFKHIKQMKNSEIIKYKRHTSEKKKILNLFKYLLDTILTDKTLMSSNEDNENENENEKNETVNQNDNNIIKQLNHSLDEIIEKIKII